MSVLLSLVLLLGVAGCWLGWQGKAADPRLATVLGWLLIAVAVLGWTARFGDAGTAIAASTAMCAGLAFLGLSAFQQRRGRVRRHQERRARSSSGPAPSPWAGALAVILAGPAAGLSALLLGLSGGRLARSAGWAEADAIVLAYAAVPLLWAALAAYLATRGRAGRKIGVLAALTGAPIVHLLVGA